MQTRLEKYLPYREAKPINLVDEPKEPRTGTRQTETSVVLRHVDASHVPLFTTCVPCSIC